MDRTARGFALALAAMAGTTAVVAQEAPARTSQIYQHRTTDGRIVLSDRPVAGAQLQRTWAIANEDAVAARETAVYAPGWWGWRGGHVRPLPSSRPGPVRPSPGTRWPPVGG